MPLRAPWVKESTGQCVRWSASQLSYAALTVVFVHKTTMELEMNKVICTLVTASVLVSGAAYGQSKPKTTKQPLQDSQMDKVTAGDSGDPASGGNIAANNSTVTTTTNGTVDLSGAALMGASGINIVSSTDA